MDEDDDKLLGGSVDGGVPAKNSDDELAISEYSDDGTPSKKSDDTGPTLTDTEDEVDAKAPENGMCILRHRKSRPQEARNDSLPGTPTRTRSHPARDGMSEQHKASTIHEIVVGQDEDAVERLRQLSISRGGMVNDDLRRIAWPKLLNIDVDKIPPAPDVSVLHAHRDYNQVVLDVNRSQKRFPPGMEEVERLEYQDQLIDTILRVLVNQPDLHYYQGYHDIVVTFLLVVGEDLTFALMNELSTKHLRDFMHPTMDQTNYMLNYLYPLISLANAKLADFMLKAETGTIFCLPWLITWYGHVLNDFRSIVRLYDFFIACHPLMPIYLAATIVLYRSEEILALPPEMPLIHSLLSHIPCDLPMERLIAQAGDLYVQYPPETLKAQADAMHRKEQERLEQTRLATEQARKARQRRLKQQQMARFRRKLSAWTLAAVVVAGLSWSIMYWRQIVLW